MYAGNCIHLYVCECESVCVCVRVCLRVRVCVHLSHSLCATVFVAKVIKLAEYTMISKGRSTVLEWDCGKRKGWAIISFKHNRDKIPVSESRYFWIRIVQCQPRVRSAKIAESNIQFLPLEEASSAVWSHFGFPERNGKILESDRKKRQLVYCKLIKQLSW